MYRQMTDDVLISRVHEKIPSYLLLFGGGIFFRYFLKILKLSEGRQ
jgi:hypothetical protein